jgi:putative ABC transport system substrate-binding protein
MRLPRRAALALPLAILPSPVRAQPRRARRIGVLHSVSVASNVNTIRILRAGLERGGFVEDRDVFFRAPLEHSAPLPDLVGRLLALDPGVLIAIGGPAVFAAAQHGQGLPVVAADLETDPVQAGLATSISRPGGHVTGLFLDQPSIAAKWLDLLLEAAPHTRHVLFLWTVATGLHQRRVAEARAAARGLTAGILDPFANRDHDTAFAGLAARQTGVVMLTAPGYAEILGPLSMALRVAGLPSIAFLSNFVGRGLLMGYGPDQALYYGRILPIAERILAGESPGAIPIERPSRYHFTVDLRVAAALGLVLPPALLAQADEVLD